jgi:hypothetical protein
VKFKVDFPVTLTIEIEVEADGRFEVDLALESIRQGSEPPLEWQEQMLGRLGRWAHGKLAEVQRQLDERTELAK